MKLTVAKRPLVVVLAVAIVDCICFQSFAQEQIEEHNPQTKQTSQDIDISDDGIITIQILKQQMTGPGRGITQLFQVSDNDEIFYNGKPLKINYPENLADKKLAYTFIYFTGRKGAVDKSTTVLVANYDSDQPKFYIDQNNNLDFTDDHQSGSVESNGSDHVLTLYGDDDESSFSIRLYPFRNEKDLTDEKKEQYRTMFQGYLKYMGGVHAETNGWFYNQRLNTHTNSVTLDGHKVMLGLHDYDCDGIFSGDTDRLLIGKFTGKQISSRKADGAVNAKVGEIFLVGKTPYRIVEVGRSGKTLKIKKSDKMPDRLFVGSTLPNFKVKSFSGDSVELASFSNPEKLQVLDFWGHWCGPCVAAIPETIEFNNKWKGQATLVGVHYGEHDQARKIIQEKGAHWPQVEFTEELKEALFIDGWPTYVLIDVDGKILSFGTTLEKIAERLQEKNTPKKPSN